MSEQRTILFVCLHGAGMSRMAAAYFNRAAPPSWHALSAGVEPAEALSATAAMLLAGSAAEGFLDRDPPRAIAAVEEPERVIALRNPSIQYDLLSDERWDLRSSGGVPLRDEIRERAETLARTIAAQEHRYETADCPDRVQTVDAQWSVGPPDRQSLRDDYGSALRGLNAIRESLAERDLAAAPAHELRALKREELAAMATVTLHELYFANLGGDGSVLFTGSGDGTGLPKPIASAIEQHFGSVLAWQREFIALAQALIGRSGWVALTFNRQDGRLSNELLETIPKFPSTLPRCWSSTCTSTRTRQSSVLTPPPISMRFCATSTGRQLPIA